MIFLAREHWFWKESLVLGLCSGLAVMFGCPTHSCSYNVVLCCFISYIISIDLRSW